MSLSVRKLYNNLSFPLNLLANQLWLHMHKKNDSKALIDTEAVNKVSKTSKRYKCITKGSPITKNNDWLGFHECLGISGLCLHCGDDRHHPESCRHTLNTLFLNLCHKHEHVARVYIYTMSKSDQQKMIKHKYTKCTLMMKRILSFQWEEQ